MGIFTRDKSYNPTNSSQAKLLNIVQFSFEKQTYEAYPLTVIELLLVIDGVRWTSFARLTALDQLLCSGKFSLPSTSLRSVPVVKIVSSAQPSSNFVRIELLLVMD